MFRWGLLALVVILLTVGITVGTALLENEAPNPKASEYATGEGHLEPSGIAAVEGDETVYDFGSMAQYSEGKHVWVIRNDGDTPLKLRNGGSDCSCTIASIGKEETAVVDPLKTTQVELTWQTKHFEGEFGKAAHITTSDPKRPTIDLKIRGMVYPAVMTLPKELNFALPDVPYDKVHTLSIAVFSPDKADLQVTGHSSSRPEIFDVRTEPMTDSDRESVKIHEGGLRVMIDIKPGLPIGRFREEVVLKTNHPKKPEIPVLVSGEVRGPITPVPNRITDTSIDQSKGADIEVTLVSRVPTVEYTVEKVPDLLEVTVAPEQGGAVEEKENVKRHVLKVHVPAGLEPQQILGDVYLKTNLPGSAETLRVPIHLVIQRAANGGA